jgi:anti-anti-sigma factor
MHYFSIECNGKVSVPYAIQKKVITIGRSKDNTISVGDLRVSRHHARFEECDEGYILTDLSTLNGTWVGGKRISRIALFNGDRITIGGCMLTFSFDEKRRPSRLDPFAFGDGQDSGDVPLSPAFDSPDHLLSACSGSSEIAPQAPAGGTTAVLEQEPVLPSEPMPVVKKERGSRLMIMALEGTLDQGTAGNFIQALDELFANGVRRLVVDLKEVTFVNSAGWKILINGQKKMRLHGGEIKLAALQEEVAKAFDLFALGKIFACYPDADAALAGFRKKGDRLPSKTPARPLAQRVLDAFWPGTADTEHVS